MNQATLVSQLQALGLRRGDTVMVHSSFKALGIKEPELIIQALLETVGDSGTLLMPALSYLQEPPEIHDTNLTPACVGFLPEYFRQRAGTVRSVHPTHSACGVGAQLHDWLGDHSKDHTPCGPHSPFSKLLYAPGKILMLGCGLLPNTTMHAIEEHAPPPYLFGAPKIYTLTDASGRTFEKAYVPHNFQDVTQRYDRVAGLLAGAALSQGIVGQAPSFLIRGEKLLEAALVRLRAEPFYFVDQPSMDKKINHETG
jgi:aminoglycoside 3-N-acetyltransferase